MNVAHFLEASARREPGRPALVFGDRRFTYAELDREAGRVAAGLARLGIRPGERVCLHLANRPEFVVAYHGGQKLGVTAVALNVTCVRDELSTTAEELIERCRGRMAPYKVPVAVEFPAALPKSPTGKILKKSLR